MCMTICNSFSYTNFLHILNSLHLLILGKPKPVKYKPTVLWDRCTNKYSEWGLNHTNIIYIILFYSWTLCDIVLSAVVVYFRNFNAFNFTLLCQQYCGVVNWVASSYWRRFCEELYSPLIWQQNTTLKMM